MKKLLLALFFLAALIGGVALGQLAMRKQRTLLLRADSIAAAADTARLLALRTLNDSTRAWQLRIVQTELQRDSVERELQSRPVIRVLAGVRVDTLRVVDTVKAVQIDTVKVYAFGGLDGPFRFDGDARILPSDVGMFDVRVTLERPIPVTARITCGNEGVVNSASLLLTAEDPFSVVPESVFQEPGICNPSVPFFEFTADRAFWAAGGFGLGMVVTYLFRGDQRGDRY